VEADLCRRCLDSWPCDAIREADRADKAEAALAGCIDRCSRTIGSGVDLLHEREAARADAERLAEALRTLVVYGTTSVVPVDRDLSDARAALAAHEEATDG
jgi:hypothetical protein